MNGMRDDLETRMREFYDQERIGVRHFGCPHRGLCEGALRAPLSHGSEAFVGSRYGEITKIAVVSLDAGGESRSLEQQRKYFEGGDEKASGTPMKETLRLLRKLLSKELDGASAMPYFALVHAAKCSPNDGAHVIPDDVFKKCRFFSKSELTLLEPDVIITQGEQAQRVLDEDFPEREVDVRDLLTPANTISGVQVFDWLTMDWLTTVSVRYLTGIRVADRNIYALHAPHPADPAWQTFEQLHLPICAWLIRELLSRSKAAATER